MPSVTLVLFCNAIMNFLSWDGRPGTLQDIAYAHSSLIDDVIYTQTQRGLVAHSDLYRSTGRDMASGEGLRCVTENALS